MKRLLGICLVCVLLLTGCTTAEAENTTESLMKGAWKTTLADDYIEYINFDGETVEITFYDPYYQEPVGYVLRKCEYGNDSVTFYEGGLDDETYSIGSTEEGVVNASGNTGSFMLSKISEEEYENVFSSVSREETPNLNSFLENYHRITNQRKAEQFHTEALEQQQQFADQQMQQQQEWYNQQVQQQQEIYEQNVQTMQGV